MTEADEVAANIVLKLADYPITFSKAVVIVRQLMSDESYTVVSNVAEALVRRAWKDRP